MKLLEFKRKHGDPFHLLALIEFCAIMDALVFFLSFGHVRSNLRIVLLFSEWLDDQQERYKPEE